MLSRSLTDHAGASHVMLQFEPTSLPGLLTASPGPSQQTVWRLTFSLSAPRFFRDLLSGSETPVAVCYLTPLPQRRRC